MTTIVSPQNIKAGVDSGRDDPAFSPARKTKESHTTWDADQIRYDATEFNCDVQEATIKEKLKYFWTLSNCPVVVNEASFQIGDIIGLRK